MDGKRPENENERLPKPPSTSLMAIMMRILRTRRTTQQPCNPASEVSVKSHEIGQKWIRRVIMQNITSRDVAYIFARLS
jgi:hypothetical protein